MRLLYMFLTQLARDIGFEDSCMLQIDTLKPLSAVRDMCADGKCRLYGTRWSCPPACGSIDVCERKIRKYSGGILVQTVGHLEDEFDLKGIGNAQRTHSDRFQTLARQMRLLDKGCLPLTAGGCTRCEACTYPKKPCRFPDKMLSSMEAYGLLVSDVCEKNGIPYYRGSGTITFTSCVLTNLRTSD